MQVENRLRVFKMLVISFAFLFGGQSVALAGCGKNHEKKVYSLPGLSAYVQKLAGKEILSQSYSSYRPGLVRTGHFTCKYYWMLPGAIERFENAGMGLFVPTKGVGIVLYNNSSEGWSTWRDNSTSLNIYVKLDEIYTTEDLVSALKSKMPTLFQERGYSLMNMSGDAVDRINIANSTKTIFKVGNRTLSLSGWFYLYGTFEQKYEPIKKGSIHNAARRLDGSVIHFQVDDITYLVDRDKSCALQAEKREHEMKLEKQKAKERGSELQL